MESSHRNAFQDLNEGRELWLSAIGKQRNAYLISTVPGAFTRHVRQRHLQRHIQEIVDADSINCIGDTFYHIGQRIVVHEYAVHDYLALTEKLATAMASDIPPTKKSES